MDAEQIVAGLTEAQKRAVNFRAHYGPTFGTIWAYDRTLAVLERLGLIRDRSGGWAYLNETGLQVRAILQEQSK